jgi:hypothetical protein
MDDTSIPGSLILVKPTFLRSKVFYSLFVTIIFAASLFLALIMLDTGISFCRLNQSFSDYVLGSVFILVGVAAVGGSLAILLPAWNQLRQAVQLERKGKVMTGLVIEKYLGKDKDGKRYGFAACVFNSNYLLEQNIPTGLYERLKEGDSIAIRCLTENPAIARLENPRG